MKSTANLHRRTPEEGIHRALEEPLCSTILLHQKERWETQTGSGLPTTERAHHPKPLPATPHTRTHQSGARRSTILEVRCTLGIQQHTHQNRRPMEGSIHHQRRTIRTKSHVLRPNQLPSYLSNDDERNLRRGT